MNPITYCMNVHPGERLEDIQIALEKVTIPLREAFAPDGFFPIGLRLGVGVAKALREPRVLKRFVSMLQHNRLATLGINGFPYGTFHGERVKEQVYQPDWNSALRVDYTRDLFYALAQLPIAQMGDYSASVTTVPLGYRLEGDISETIFEDLCEIALFLRKLEGFTGKRMCLALEPEPDCLLESTQTTIDFFERLWRHPLWTSAYRHYIGVCFDTCHFAVNYEDPLRALQRLVAAKIPIARIQVSAALAFHPQTSPEALRPYIDTVYLHQTRVSDSHLGIRSYRDFTEETLACVKGKSGRIHYHIPLAWAGTTELQTTRSLLTPAFWRYVRAGGWPLEIESYAYHVYPDNLRKKTLSEWLLEDLMWVKRQLQSV